MAVKKFYRIGPRISYLIHRRNPWGNLSYADLITQAIKSSPDQRLTLAQVSMTHFLRHYSVAPLLGRLLSLLISIKLGLQGLQGTHTLADCAHLEVKRKIKCCEYSIRDSIHNTPFSSQLTNGSSKLECFITLNWKGLSGTKTRACCTQW